MPGIQDRLTTAYIVSRGCACPRLDARDCLRFRVRDDMREMLGDEPSTDDDDVCECTCHDQGEEDGDDDL